MSGSEEDIWGYKSIRKKKAAGRSAEKTSSQAGSHAGSSVQGKKKAAKKSSRNATRVGSKKSPARNITSPARNGLTGTAKGHNTSSPGAEDSPTPRRTLKTDTRKASPRTPKAKHGGCCPSCQMPFSILLVQTPRWHVSECMDSSPSAQTECPDGLTCSSTIASHYKRYSHFLLAQSRAAELSLFPPICPPDLPSPDGAESLVSNGRKDAKGSRGAATSPSFTKKSTNVRSSQTRSPASSQGSVKQSSLDAWLSSPTKSSQKSLDFSQVIPSQKSPVIQSQKSPVIPNQKSPVIQRQKSQLIPSQKSPVIPSQKSPVIPNQKSPAGVNLSQDDDYSDNFLISYSPLVSDQELFSDDDDDDLRAGPVKKLFPDQSPAENVEERFAANEHFITQSGLKSPANRNDTSASKSGFVRSSGVTCVADCSIEAADWSECSINAADWSECSTPVSGISERSTAQPQAERWAQEEAEDLLVGSANGYREAAYPRRGPAAAVEKALCASTQPATRLVPANSLHAKLSLTQIPSDMSAGSAAPSKAMKQTDIGVFFGLKPKPKAVEQSEVKVPLKTQSPNAGVSQVEEKWPKKKRKDAESLTGNAGWVPATAPSGTPKRERKRKAVGSLSDADSLGGVVAPSGNQKRERKRFRQNSAAEETKGRKQCPFYKKIPGTGFTVDAFQYGAIEGCSAYFLTHFHSDHYGGLTKKFRYPIYCSKITGNLVASKLRVENEFINPLPMDTECVVDNVKVILLDANHCPGAVLLLFILPNGTTILHTGDFRADTSMERYPALIGRKINTLYLDTTYCSPEYTFPPQQEAIQFAVNTAFEMMTLHPRTLVVCGTYSVGKEKVFLAIADVLGCKVCMSPDKFKTMQCLESDEIRSLVTTDWLSTALHVLPMMQVNFKGLGAHLNKFSGKYDRVLAFKPTGWTYSHGCSSVADIRPAIRGKITMYGIPYSEHSSYLEMKRFVQFTKPQKIIPTVNVGDWKARSAMERYFAEWLLQARLK